MQRNTAGYLKTLLTGVYMHLHAKLSLIAIKKIHEDKPADQLLPCQVIMIPDSWSGFSTLAPNKVSTSGASERVRLMNAKIIIIID